MDSLLMKDGYEARFNVIINSKVTLDQIPKGFYNFVWILFKKSLEFAKRFKLVEIFLELSI